MFKKLSKLFLAALLLGTVGLVAQDKSTNIRTVTVVDENGRVMIGRSWAGLPPKEPVGSFPSPDEVYVGDGSKALIKLDNVPAYNWCTGCTATATAMWAGYYDNFGADQMYTGPENGGVAPLSSDNWISQGTINDTDWYGCALAASEIGVDGRASKGHGEDYWQAYNSEGDPYFGNWTEHDWYSGQPCTGDFMGTSQFNNWNNTDGSTTVYTWVTATGGPSGAKIYDCPDSIDPLGRDVAHGMKLFIEQCGYTVKENWNQNITGYIDADYPDEPVEGGYEFEDFKASIDKGIPVLVHVIGHTMLGYGYDEAYSPPRIYVRNTWTTAQTDYYFSWGGEYSGMLHNCMTALVLDTEYYYAAPDNVFALNANRIVTVTWDDPSNGTKSMSYEIYRDGGLVGTSSTESYVDDLSSGAYDGVHTYSVKAVYLDPDPDFTSYMSDEAPVYVSVSVTSFYDDFEGAENQWLIYDGWGFDSQFSYAGTYSLGSSPGALDPNNTDQLAAGGSVGEVAPGLDFSAAHDAQCTFWLKSDLELSFDYAHFQACKDGINWVTLKTWNGQDDASTTFYYEDINLGVFAGEANVRFRFLLVTDPYTTFDGMNIDNFDISPASVDTSPPFVFYTKDVDYYDNNANGFEIYTEITDYTGIDYAHVIYNVDGGSDITIEPTSVNGNEYYFVIPEQTPGAYVEFDFDCGDTMSPANTGTYGGFRMFPGPFMYRAGLHQKFDTGFVSYYTEFDLTDQTAYANQFSSFHDDIVGLVVRGYFADGMSDNAEMDIYVWADDNGSPGAALITPLAFTNPATIDNTNKWGYVDLSGYTELDDMAGDYYAGFKCGAGSSGITRTVATSTGDAQEYDYGKAWIEYDGGSGLVWEQYAGNNHHLRLVTTNYGYEPGIIDPVESSLTETLAVDGTSSTTLTLENAGDYEYNYNAEIDYLTWPGGSVATLTVNENDFEAGLTPYTNTGTDLSFVETGGAAVVTASPINNRTKQGQLTSDTFDGTVCQELNIAFDQDFAVGTQSNCSVEYYDGSLWNTVYSASSTTTASQNITIPNTATQIRFTANLYKNDGSWTIDNVVVSGPEAVQLTWLTLDGAATTSGTVTDTGSDDITIGYDAAGLEAGEYTANILLTAPDSPDAQVPVTLIVTSGGGAPDTPANIVTSISGTDLVIDWDASVGATGYDVYSSDDPYAATPWSLVTSVATNQYTVAADQAKLFYYIVATNANKTVEKKSIKDVKEKTGK